MGHMRIATLPERMAAGAFIIDAGLGKLRSDGDRADTIHDMAKGAYPVLGDMKAEQFTKLLGASETALGAALVLPFVGDGLAGLGLTAFGAGLMGLYLKTPGLRREGSVLPSARGTAVAKDVWLLGIGLSLLASSVRHRTRRKDASS